jgi:hypothetical protein
MCYRGSDGHFLGHFCIHIHFFKIKKFQLLYRGNKAHDTLDLFFLTLFIKRERLLACFVLCADFVNVPQEADEWTRVETVHVIIYGTIKSVVYVC